MKILDAQESYVCVKKLANRIRGIFHPDIIIAIARGGWIPTVLLSNLLQVHQIASMGIRHEESTRDILVVYSYPSLAKIDRQFILVDDRLEIARSLVLAREYFMKHSDVIKLASIYIRDDCIITPDYYLDVYNQDVLFDWFSKNNSKGGLII